MSLTRPLMPVFLEDELGIAPSGLQFCFDRECFLNPVFQSSEFILTQDRRGISLETCRDSLLQYSNILKSSLIELINQDYADFVNLSTTLVDLDKGIASVSSPLESLKSSVSELITELSTTENLLSAKLCERQQIREKKDLLNSLCSVDQCVSRLERWLSQDITNGTGRSSCDHLQAADSHLDKLDSDLQTPELDFNIWPPGLYIDCSLQEDSGIRIERVASEYSRLQFFSRRCQQHPLVQSMKPRIHWITSTLLEQMEAQLKKSLDDVQLTSTNNNPVVSKVCGERLRHAVSTYLMIDRLPDVVQLYRQYVLRPKLGEVFTSRPELSCSGSDAERASVVLEEMFATALVILDLQLEVFHRLSCQRAPDSYDPLGEFDCLIDGFWPETVELLIENTPDIFTSGYPDRFYKLHKASQIFMKHLEERLHTAERIRNFRNHSAYHQFLNRWSLPVYFQIRFQEIAGSVENAVQIGLSFSTSNSFACRLHITAVVMEQLERCWEDGVYLSSLRHRFLKLTLQLLSRYANFAQSQIESFLTRGDSTASSDSFADDTDKLVCLLIDCRQLSAHARLKLPGIISRAVGPLPAMLTECLDECAQLLVTVLAPLGNAVSRLVQISCITANSQVSDIPRQYRRTNRAYPNAPSVYVTGLISPLDRLAQWNTGISDDSTCEALAQVVQRCVEQVAAAFLSQLIDVLNSVKKTEESLRKLREARRASSNLLDQTAQTPTESCLDEDKIRHQLYLDACYFSDQVNNLWGINEQTRKKLHEIVQLTKMSRTDASLNGHQ